MSTKAIDATVREMGIDPIFLPVLEEIVVGLNGFEYHLLSKEKFGEIFQSNVTDGCRCYWYDILQRAHLGSVMGLLRQHRWLLGAITAASTPNFHVFTSSVRGLLESSADIWHGLNGVAKTLAVEFSSVQAALTGGALQITTCKELEDQLVHFQFAGRLPGKSPSDGSTQPKSQREYLTHLQGDSNGPLHDWYGELCDITHPGTLSLFSFSRGKEDSSGTRYRIDNTLDRTLIETHCRKHSQNLVKVLQQGVNLPLLTLKTINELPIPEFHSSVLDGINLGELKAWRFIEQQIAQARRAEVNSS